MVFFSVTAHWCEIHSTAFYPGPEMNISGPKSLISGLKVSMTQRRLDLVNCWGRVSSWERWEKWGFQESQGDRRGGIHVEVLAWLKECPARQSNSVQLDTKLFLRHKCQLEHKGTVPGLSLPPAFSAWNFITWIHLGRTPSKGNKFILWGCAPAPK